MLPKTELLFGLMCIVTILISIPLILKKIGPNPVYGVRTPKTMSSPEIWYDINAYFGWGFLISGIITLVATLALPLFVASLDAYTLLVLVIMLVLTTITLILSMGRMRKF